MVEPLAAELGPAFGREAAFGLGSAFGLEAAARLQNYSSYRLFQKLISIATFCVPKKTWMEKCRIFQAGGNRERHHRMGPPGSQFLN